MEGQNWLHRLQGNGELILLELLGKSHLKAGKLIWRLQTSYGNQWWMKIIAGQCILTVGTISVQDKAQCLWIYFITAADRVVCWVTMQNPSCLILRHPFEIGWKHILVGKEVCSDAGWGIFLIYLKFWFNASISDVCCHFPALKLLKPHTNIWRAQVHSSSTVFLWAI